ncbi:MAG: tagatose-bisphosphate aldolase [Candidatus Liptonbacteria bacterium GWC1_60_9]|uniref:Tagatose-bisphosphate aldolase n=1 Tax=Candidatus Liptonbacteria bacterium GWC1_60_9 TaxID=1798645 RepID=A0A1G2C8D4_9BACT|nr:MAG: tagatose-bisphosphate aldolase [Candidatus Liptonbacteria bacterium GWC1_60_9]
MTLQDALRGAEQNKTAIGHFNISDLAGLHGIVAAARELKVPVIIGVSEGERKFVGVRQVVALVKSMREELNHPIFLNADHTKTLEGCVEAATLGFDAVLFDGSTLPLEENIRETKAVADAVRAINPAILVEGELGYIGSSSEIREGIPEGAAIKPEDLTKPEEAARFVKETGVDLVAPAVGNIHGMMANAPEPNLDIKRVADIAAAAGVPLVLHGASGNTDDDVRAAVEAGVRIVHINTEIRVAWRKGLEAALAANPKEVAPYKILPGAIEGVKSVVLAKLRVFNRIS